MSGSLCPTVCSSEYEICDGVFISLRLPVPVFPGSLVMGLISVNILILAQRFVDALSL